MQWNLMVQMFGHLCHIICAVPLLIVTAYFRKCKA